MTPLQQACQTGQEMADLVQQGFTTNEVYSAVKRGDLINTKATDDWGRKLKCKGLFKSTVTAVPYNAAALVAAWNNQLGEHHV